MALGVPIVAGAIIGAVTGAAGAAAVGGNVWQGAIIGAGAGAATAAASTLILAGVGLGATTGLVIADTRRAH